MRDFENVDFKVYEEERTVVCIIYECKNIAVNRIKKHMPIDYMKYPGEYQINDVYAGVAKCATIDEFNPEIGKQIAFDKARKRRNKAVNRALKKYIKDVNNALFELEINEIHEFY